MVDKIGLEHSEDPPVCPFCEQPLREMHWHKVRGGPPNFTYITIMSCPHCRKVLGSVGA